MRLFPQRDDSAAAADASRAAAAHQPRRPCDEFPGGEAAPAAGRVRPMLHSQHHYYWGYHGDCVRTRRLDASANISSLADYAHEEEEEEEGGTAMSRRCQQQRGCYCFSSSRSSPPRRPRCFRHANKQQQQPSPTFCDGSRSDDLPTEQLVARAFGQLRAGERLRLGLMPPPTSETTAATPAGPPFAAMQHGRGGRARKPMTVGAASRAAATMGTSFLEPSSLVPHVTPTPPKAEIFAEVVVAGAESAVPTVYTSARAGRAAAGGASMLLTPMDIEGDDLPAFPSTAPSTRRLRDHRYASPSCDDDEEEEESLLPSRYYHRLAAQSSAPQHHRPRAVPSSVAAAAGDESGRSAEGHRGVSPSRLIETPRENVFRWHREGVMPHRAVLGDETVDAERKWPHRRPETSGLAFVGGHGIGNSSAADGRCAWQQQQETPLPAGDYDEPPEHYRFYQSPRHSKSRAVDTVVFDGTLVLQSLLLCPETYSAGVMLHPAPHNSIAAVRRPPVTSQVDIQQEGAAHPGDALAAEAKATKDGQSWPIECHVCGCTVPASTVLPYLRSRRICTTCTRAEWVMNQEGVKVRYCQLAGWTHPLEFFDGSKRSCRRELNRHNSKRKARNERTIKKMAAIRLSHATL